MKSVTRWLLANHRFLGFTLAAVAPVSIGFYTNVYTGFATQEPARPIIEIVRACGLWNLLLPAFLLSLYGQYCLSHLPETQFANVRANLVSRLLAAACRSLVYPKSLETAHIRAIVSLVDAKLGKRVARYSFNAEPDPERQGEWPIAFGVTGEAITGKQVVLKELGEDHHAAYSAEVRSAVLDGIRTILAAPIFDPANRRGAPLGVVAFDSILSIKELGFDHREIRNVAQAWADLVAIVLTQHGMTDEIQ